jgi:molybdopterin molybdotransferase
MRVESVETAQRRLLERVSALGVESVPLRQAPGRVLAREVVAGDDLPAWPNSSMDGYAVHSRDTLGAPLSLPVVGEIRAGDPPGAALTAGQAIRIMTGAPLPAGADAVIRHEDTDHGREVVELRIPVHEGTAVRPAGNDVRRGECALAAGRRLRAADLAVCAALGHDRVETHRRPRIGLLTNGEELVPVGARPRPGQIVDSNAVALTALVEEAGGVPVVLGIAGDDRAAIRARLDDGAATCDLVVSCAGVSAGDHDHVRGAVEDIGSVELWQVAMRPGRPVVIGEVRGVPFAGLPGNPVSAQLTFELFVRPAILALQGAAHVHRRRGMARALEPVSKPAGLATYHRAQLVDQAGDIPGFRLTGDQSSGRLRSLTDADCFVVLAASAGHIAPGTLVPTIPLG